ncbi:MAG: cysteine desulfurase [FCB group bacterium]|jgi:cysteine desulfurase/selenocysteine lyase|nr:cysteine desulfurase [FCB group bacterium]
MSVIEQDIAESLSEEEVLRIRQDFPILRQTVRDGKTLVYLDNAATSQKPQSVIDITNRYYCELNSNVHRGVHRLSEVATEAYEGARIKVKRFFNVPLSCETIFTRGATDSINLVAQTYGRKHVGAGDEIVISAMEHHSNIVPWQMICEEKGAKLRVIPINDRGELLLDEYANLLNERTKIVAVTQVSNALGTVNPIKKMAAMAHSAGAAILVDGAQSSPHMPVDVQDLDVDFFVCSSHKMVGPTGIGVMYGRAKMLESMPPYQGGGDMILSVTFEKTTFNSLPYKFEAGTPNIAGAIGFGTAIDYLTATGMGRIAAYEQELLAYCTQVLESISGVRLIGTASEKAGVLSFWMDCAHPHDIGQILDGEGVAIRAGHHCAQPVMQRFGVPATARASLAFYNTKQELDALGRAIHKVKEVFE